MMSIKQAIVAMLGDYVSDIWDFFYDESTDEVWRWDGENKVCTPFDDFVILAYDKWSQTHTTSVNGSGIEQFGI